MSEEGTTEAERSDVEPATDETVETETETETEVETGATLDVEAAAEQEGPVQALRERAQKQQERIEELEDLVLDLSTRVADGRGMGVCPDCHGPVIKSKPWFRSAKIKCADCGRVFHEY